MYNIRFGKSIDPVKEYYIPRTNICKNSNNENVINPTDKNVINLTKMPKSKLKKNYLQNENKQNIKNSNITAMIYVPIGKGFPDFYLWKIWKLIVKTSKFNVTYIKEHFDYKSGKDPNTRVASILDNFKKSDADILIGDYFTLYDKDLAFTNAIMLSTPIILYNNKYGLSNAHNTIADIKSVLKSFAYSFYILILPMLIFLIFGFVLGIIIFYTHEKQNLRWSFLETFASLLGAHDTLISKSNPNKFLNFIFTLIVLLISFLFTIYLTARLTSSQVQKNLNTDPFEESIEGKKIVVNGDVGYRDVKLRGGIPVRYPRGFSNNQLIEKFIKNKKEDGILIFPESINNHAAKSEMKKYPGLKISKYHMTIQKIGFVVKKNNCTLLQKINDIILKLHDTQKIYNICKNEYPRNPRVCNKDFLL